jgi:hypothetical protein
MTESRKLPIPSFLPQFREMLCGSMVLGRYAIREGLIENGSLRVWVPDAVDAIRPEDIRWDIFYPGPHQPARFGMDQAEREAIRLINDHLSRQENALVAADAIQVLSRPEDVPRTVESSWFSCDSMIDKYPSGVCLYLRHGQQSMTACEELLRKMNRYPSSIVLTSVPQEEMPQHTGYVAPETMRTLIRRTEHILVGAFDEMSYLWWSRQLPDSVAAS